MPYRNQWQPGVGIRCQSWRWVLAALAVAAGEVEMRPDQADQGIRAVRILVAAAELGQHREDDYTTMAE